MGRFALGWLRVFGALAVGAAVLTTSWMVRGGTLDLVGYVAGGAAMAAVYLGATRPPPRPWVEPDQLEPDETVG